MWRVNSSAPPIARRACVNWIMLIYFASGVCSLIDEVVWVRLLKLTLGNTVYATSIVVSVFMGGLALGALIMGRYSDSVKRRLRLYALLETLVTISALALPWGLKLADTVYVWFYRAYHPTHVQLLLVQVVISAAILLVPSMLMGSTLPLLGRFVTALEKEAGHLVGRLYALNTLGAATGCFLAGFVLVRFLGVMGALYSAAILNLVVAFGGWFLSRFSDTTVEEQPAVVVVAGPEVAAAKTPDGRFYLLILAFFMSGLISIGYELLWMRSIVHLLGGFTYVFSAVLTVYLLGNVIGAGIGSGLVRELKIPAAGFAVTLSLLGLCGVFYLPWLLLWTSKVLPDVNREIDLTARLIPFSAYMVKPLVQSMFLFLMPCIIMGIGFPIALQAWANHMHKVGRSTGTAYGANTIGAVMGGIVTGFVLIPLLGLQLSISILGLTGVWIAGIMGLVFVRGWKVVGRCALLGLAVILTIFTVTTPLDLFNKVIRLSPFIPRFELVWVEEGTTLTVSLHRDAKDDALWLCTSGAPVAGDTYFWRGDQKMLGHFGVLLNSDAKKILSVGFGSGESTACMSLHKLERADCVEIAPEVVKVSLNFFRHINLGDRLDEEINMIYMDAKNYIHLTDTKYDAIVNDVIGPRIFAENASLYTKEYFTSAKEHLNDKGLFMSWIPTYDYEPAPIVNSIIGTMMDVFPYVTIWYMAPNPAAYFLVIGSEQPQYFSPKHIDNELLKEDIGESLSAVNINNSMDILSCYIGDENDLRRYITSFSMNSDYSPFIEFATDDQPAGSYVFNKFITEVRGDSIYEHIDWTGFNEEQKEEWLEDYQRLYEASTYLFMFYHSANYLEQLKNMMDGLAILPDNPALLHFRAQAENDLLSVGTKMIQDGRIDDALELSSRMLEIYPRSAIAWVLKSESMQHRGETQEALTAAQQAIELAPDNADARLRHGLALFATGQYGKALTEYQEVLQLGKRRGRLTRLKQAKVLDALADAYAAIGRFPDAIAAAEKAFNLALATEQKEMADSIKRRLLLFKTGHTVEQQP